jgi:hypothetical protein
MTCVSHPTVTIPEEFRGRDVDSTSCYLKPDHDVVMTLSEIRDKLPFSLIARHVKGPQDDEREYADLTRPEQLNVKADYLATAALDELREAGQPTEFYPLPACRGYLCDSTGYITSKEKRTLRTELPEYKLRAHLQERNNWTDEVYDSISWSAYRSASAQLTDSFLTFMVKFSHSWLPIGVRERRCSATTDLCPQYNEIETVAHLYRCQARVTWRYRFLIHLQGHLADTHTADDMCDIIVEGIQNLFLTGDTNDPDSEDPTLQIGWLQVFKGYIPHEWNTLQEGFFRSRGKSSKYYTGELSYGRIATPFEKIGAQLHTHLQKIAQTIPALAPYRRHNNEWKRHTHTLPSW